MTGLIDAERQMPDTNVVVYAHDVDAGLRHERSVALIEDLQRRGRIVVSTQVLNEFYWAITRPTRTAPLSHAEAVEIVEEIVTAWEVVPVTAAITRRALEAMPPYGLAFWDALIWAAARENGVRVIYSEDFQDGRDVEGVRFVNPFVAPA